MAAGARLVVLGKQGAGKGTQCLSPLPPLCRHPCLHRGHAARGRQAGHPARHEGQGADGPRRAAGRRPDHGDGLRAGWRRATPRTAASSSTAAPAPWPRPEMLADLLAPVDLDLVIDIEVPTSPGAPPAGRRGGCASTAGPTTRCSPRPLINWTCDVCGGEVVQREDDTEEAISRRLEIYEQPDRPADRLVPGPGPAGPGARHRLARGGHQADRAGHRGPPQPQGRTVHVTGPYDDGHAARRARPTSAPHGHAGPGGTPDEAQRRRAGQDAQGRPGGGRDPRGHPGRHPPRRHHLRHRPGRPRRCSRSGARAPTSSATTGSRRWCARRPTP